MPYICTTFLASWMKPTLAAVCEALLSTEAISNPRTKEEMSRKGRVRGREGGGEIVRWSDDKVNLNRESQGTTVMATIVVIHNKQASRDRFNRITLHSPSQ